MGFEKMRGKQRNDIIAQRDEVNGHVLLLLSNICRIAMRPIGTGE
jgi:hypothetical protein